MRRVQGSRWIMQYFAVAVASLVLAEGILTTKWASPLANIGNAGVLVAVHLTTIGFLTLVMLGALHQFVPVLTKKDLAYPVLSGFTLILVSLGLFGMIAGFLALPGTVPGGIFPPIPWILPMGGALVVVGVVLAVMNMWVTMGRAWPWTLSTWFVASGLFFCNAYGAGRSVFGFILSGADMVYAATSTSHGRQRTGGARRGWRGRLADAHGYGRVL